MSELGTPNYQPGKYELNPHQLAAEYVYNLTLQGLNEEEYGSVTDVGWHALIMFSDEETADIVALMNGFPNLATEDQPRSAIVVEDDRGFVTVTYFGSYSNAQDAWDAVIEELEAQERHLFTDCGEERNP